MNPRGQSQASVARGWGLLGALGLWHWLLRNNVLRDTLLTLACLYSAGALRRTVKWGNFITDGQTQLPWQLYATVGGIWLLTFLLVLPRHRQHDRSLLRKLTRVLGAVALASFSFAGVLYLSFRDVSRLLFLYFAALDCAVLLFVHAASHIYLNSRQLTKGKRRVLLVGGGAVTHQLIHEFTTRPWSGVELIGFVNDGGDREHHLYLGNYSDVGTIISAQAVDDVVFTMLPQQQAEMTQLALACAQHVTLHMAPSVLDLAFARRSVGTVGGVPLIGLRESALSEGQRLAKRIFDVIAALLLLIVSSPAMAVIALLIKRESQGPILFVQERVGEHGRRIKMFKFRTMYVDADQQWQTIAQRDDDGQLQHKTMDDPRITPFGRILRRTSLDELPQLFNVLRGNMSLVGPRPELPYIVAEYEPWQWQRFRVPAGMTGWWQINGRSNRQMHLHTEDDLYYIDNYSFWLDLKILWKTCGVVLRGQGAF